MFHRYTSFLCLAFWSGSISLECHGIGGKINNLLLLKISFKNHIVMTCSKAIKVHSESLIAKFRHGRLFFKKCSIFLRLDLEQMHSTFWFFQYIRSTCLSLDDKSSYKRKFLASGFAWQQPVTGLQILCTVVANFSLSGGPKWV